MRRGYVEDAPDSGQAAAEQRGRNPASALESVQTVLTSHLLGRGTAPTSSRIFEELQGSSNHYPSQTALTDYWSYGSTRPTHATRTSPATSSKHSFDRQQRQSPLSLIPRRSPFTNRFRAPTADMFSNQDDEIRLPASPRPSAHGAPSQLQRTQQQLRALADSDATSPRPTPIPNISARQYSKGRLTPGSLSRGVDASTKPVQSASKRRGRENRARGTRKDTSVQSPRMSQVQARLEQAAGKQWSSPQDSRQAVQIANPEPASSPVQTPSSKSNWKVSDWMEQYQAEADADPLAKYYD